MDKNNSKKKKKITKPSLHQALNTLDKDFDEKVKMLLKTPPIREKDLKKKK